MSNDYVCTGIEGNSDISIHSNPSTDSPNKQQHSKCPSSGDATETHSSAKHKDSNKSTHKENATTAKFINSFKPTIKVEERLQLYQQKYEQNRKSRQKEQAPLQEEMSNPVVNEISERIISSLDRIPKVEDRLLMEGEKMKKDKETRIKQEEDAIKLQSKPLISDAARKIERDEDIVKHLYDCQKIVEQKKEALKSKYSEESKCSFAPQIDTEKNLILAKKYQERSTVKRECEKDVNCTFRPKVLKKSELLAMRQGTTEERLMSSKEKVSIEERPTFAPEINPTSNVLAQRSREGKNVERWEELYQMSTKMKENREALKKIYDEEKVKVEACTFQPNLVSREYNPNDGPVETRTHMWEKRKEEKLEFLRQNTKEKGLDQCTFRPKVNNAVNDNQNPTIQISLNSMQRHVEKMKQHRESKDTIKKQEEQKTGNGKKWTHKTTTPVTFQLGLHKQKEPAQVKAAPLEEADFKGAIQFLHQQLHSLQF